VLINWNRLHLLKTTIESYLSTISVPYELIIVDDYSTDGSRNYIESICKRDSRHKSILLTEHTGGGESINLGLKEGTGLFFHVSENDNEYIDGWDKNLLKKFEVFPELGQIGFRTGPIYRHHICKELKRENNVIYVTPKNVGTTCIFRRELWDKGVRWRSVPTKGKFRFPDDGKFSSDVKKFGYLVAWNDKNFVINWGHNVKEWIENIDYYIENYKTKPRLGIEGFRKRLEGLGYELVFSNGKYSIEKKKNPNNEFIY